jgi:hypothetical protein
MKLSQLSEELEEVEKNERTATVDGKPPRKAD